jgi:PadR family transcriptional regulator PadR
LRLSLRGLTAYIGKWYIPNMAAMREPTYYILASLIDEPRHGWAIVKEAGELSQGRIRLTAGTLYGALDRLQSDGLVEADHEEIVNGRCRRYYRLTALGQRLLQEEAARLAASAQVVHERLSSIRPRETQGATS